MSETPALRNKSGPITKDEIKFIKANHATLSPAQIASKLRRNEETIKHVLVHTLKLSDDETPQEEIDQLSIQKKLMRSPEWDALRDEFLESELKYFKHRFAKLMNQFGDDVWATEETQIFLLIKYEILMQRNLKDAKRSTLDIERLEKMLDELYSDYPEISSMDDSTKAMVNNLENQLLSHRAAKQSKSTEYEKLTGRHSALMKDLKGTRDQRLNKIENSKQTFIDVIRELESEEKQAQVGRQIELANLAMQKEKARLSQVYTYDDGNADQPLLTAENVL